MDMRACPRADVRQLAALQHRQPAGTQLRAACCHRASWAARGVRDGRHGGSGNSGHGVLGCDLRGGVCRRAQVKGADECASWATSPYPLVARHI